ncbi:hypothetical protein EC9_28690 [Rosistilla ulvae]|uniref:Putative zinc-finger domain-containing protein n=1 Tax=Rosistilla ulvae TaxID=1930277 RepID=A0A517M1C1_9BACT|nr:zf-HC2 domain-containing protein [Rosistilla ulvae]QDS88678.1 hypothetical protein EC9_28690 [Rosistilla ulvae]
MNHQEPPTPFGRADDWTRCAPGTLSQFVRRQRRERRRKTVRRVVLPTLLVGCLGLGVWAQTDPNAPTPCPFGVMDCGEIQAQLPQYVRGDLEPETQDAFQRHIEQCPACSAKMRELENPQSPVAAAGTSTKPNVVAQHPGSRWPLS